MKGFDLIISWLTLLIFLVSQIDFIQLLFEFQIFDNGFTEEAVDLNHHGMTTPVKGTLK